MELTGTPFVVLTAVLAIVAFAVAVWAMPRLAGSRPRLLARIVALALVNALVVLAGVVYLNASNGWYASWGDLLGTEARQETAAVGDAAQAAAAPTAAAATTTAPPVELPPLPSPGQRKQVYTYTGRASGMTGQIEVILPASYETAQAKDRRYPVVEAFHGFPGTPSGWTSKMQAQQSFDAAIAAGAVGEVILVAPTITATATVDSECVNGPSGTPQIETWIAQDVPRFIREHFRVKPARDSWVAMGYSVGAYCATMMGVHHNDTFGAIVALGGSVRPDFSTGAPWPAGSPLAARYDLLAQIRTQPPPVAMYLQVGKQSPFWPELSAFLAAIRPPTSMTSTVLLDSGHRWDLWQAEMPKVAAWLGSRIPGFKPGTG
ncbi:MAG: hypothetical protein KDB39_04935 [Austwickia sp.]|nr:esterase family protein [Actinomycetota bacterium]MCB1252582.1 hypothetical protein [Austwickia sp.]